METQRGVRQWFRLDNAAKLYPAISSVQWTSMFRLSFVMTGAVSPQRLEDAVNQVLPLLSRLSRPPSQGTVLVLPGGESATAFMLPRMWDILARRWAGERTAATFSG